MSQKSHKCIRLYPKPEVLNYIEHRVAVCDVIGTHICMLVQSICILHRKLSNNSNYFYWIRKYASLVSIVGGH